MQLDVELKDVNFTYEGSDVPALQDINLSIAPGEIVLLTGPAGSGKTTLSSLLNGLIPHYHEGDLQGEVLVRGYNTRRSRVGGLASLVGMVFQDPESQLVTASVVDEVSFGPENMGVPREEINRLVAGALQATRLEGYDERDPHSLSGGEQQACVIAAIYAMEPEIYVMDEPLANLDPAGRAQVLKLVVEVAKQRGKTLLLVEHALEEVLPLVDRVIILDHGRIIRDGHVAEVLQAGDIPGVFTRPPLVRLADDLRFQPLSLTIEEFCRSLFSRYQLKEAPAPSPPPAPEWTSDPVIQIKDLHFAYSRQAPALRGVDLTIQEGELVAILGRNGSGKTTLVRHIIGLLQPDQGEVTVLGKDVASTPTHELAQDVGFCFQNPNHQIVSFNVRDEMAFGLKAHKVDPEEHPAAIAEALAFVDMQDYLNAEVFDLGKGQKQRLALASVLTLKPRILIIDEPTTGQDPRMAEEIFQIIKRLNEAGTTVLLITHKVDFAARYAHRAVVMRQGKVTYDGPVLPLLADRELLVTNSLDLPLTTRLAAQLSQYGVPPWAVSYEDIQLPLRRLLESNNDH